MRKRWLSVPVLVFFVMILAGCTSLLNQLPAEVSDLSTLKSTDQLYILTIFVDEDVENLISAIATAEPSDSATKTLANIYDIYDEHSVAVQKLRSMLSSSNGLTSKTDLEVQITGQAKEDILETLSSEGLTANVQNFLFNLPTLEKSIAGISKTVEKFEPGTSQFGTLLNGTKNLEPNISKLKNIMQSGEEPANLVVDYRDIMYLRGIVNLLLAIYDSKGPVDYDLAKIDEISSVDDPLSYLLTDTAYTRISEFSGKYADVENPPATEALWNDLKTLVNDLAGSSPNLMMSSLFKPNVLSFQGFKFLIDEADFFIDIVNKVYGFEVTKTDSNGWTDNDKTSLYEYITKASEEDDISIKTGLDVKINPPEMESGNTMTELKFGAVDMFKSPKYIDLIKEFDRDLPTGNLAVSTKLQIRPTEEGSETIPVDVSLSVTLKFGELRNEPFDLLNNNIGIKKAMIQALIDMDPPIWEIITEENVTPEQVSGILDIVYSNLTFYDNATKTLTITLDNGITIKASVTVPEG